VMKFTKGEVDDLVRRSSRRGWTTFIAAFRECPRDATEVWIGGGRPAELRQVSGVRARVDGAGVELWVDGGVDHDDRALRENLLATVFAGERIVGRAVLLVGDARWKKGEQ